MKKRAVSMILAAAMVCGMMAANVSCVSAKGSDEGKVINIYSWNDEFRQRPVSYTHLTLPTKLEV